MRSPRNPGWFIQAHIDRHWNTFGFIATFRVEASWKGLATPTIRIRSDPPGGGSCGLGWRAGDQWVIYAYLSELLSTNGCSRSRFGEAAIGESRALGKPSMETRE